jgi:hypothetical protein
MNPFIPNPDALFDLTSSTSFTSLTALLSLPRSGQSLDPSFLPLVTGHWSLLRSSPTRQTLFPDETDQRDQTDEIDQRVAALHPLHQNLLITDARSAMWKTKFDGAL